MKHELVEWWCNCLVVELWWVWTLASTI